MARESFDREDLLREATALTERVEISLTASAVAREGDDTIVIGFRQDGCGSVYFGQDLAYHFNTSHQLRRAFDHGTLVKAVAGRLASMTRQRHEGQVQLVRHDLTEDENDAALARWEHHRGALHTALAAGQYRIVGQVPEGIDLLSRVIEWLAAVERPTIADVPGAR